MPRNNILIQNQDAARALVAKPSPTWADGDVLTAYDLLTTFAEIDHPNTPFNALEAAMAAAPVVGFPAALAKARWLIEQPEDDGRHDWEPVAIESLRDFLSPKDDFVAELGLRMGAIIDGKQDEDSDALDAQLEAVDALIEISPPTSIAGVTVQVLLAIRNLLDIGGHAHEYEDERLMGLIHSTKAMLEIAAPVLADIAGVDLDADYGAYYGTDCGERQKSKRPSPLPMDEVSADEAVPQCAEIPINPWVESIATYVAAPGDWWNDDRLADAAALEAECREWVSSACNSEPSPSSEEFDAITMPLCDLTSAIMAAPVEGVIGARAKLRMIKADDWDARLRTDLSVCMQSILDGLNAALGDADEAGEPALKEAA
jgi:hypothetical protein